MAKQRTYTFKILAALRRGPVLRSAFPQIKAFDQQIRYLNKVLPNQQIIGEWIETGKWIKHKERSYRLVGKGEVL